MKIDCGTIIWQQFGAAIDMLDNTLRSCIDELWSERLWDSPSERAEYSQFWSIAYYSLFWLDIYLSGAQEGFAPPALFINGSLPEKLYTKDKLLAYLEHCSQKCQSTIEALTDERINQSRKFSWGELASFSELQLYSMRHVQENAAQLSLLLGQKSASTPDWCLDQKAELVEGRLC
jgi:hypothetical protein